MGVPSCRFCGAALRTTFVDLGMSPLANSYVAQENVHKPETFYPLHAYICTECKLVQLEEFEAPEEIFDEYLYFSSFSEGWLSHAERYAEEMTARLNLGVDSFVVEVASNDGYLLQYFRERDIPVLGIEPAANVAAAAQAKGIESQVAFFGKALAQRLGQDRRSADLIVANNVLAHVPDINDFVGGMKALLAGPAGVVTVEFPHLLQLVQHTQYDTIYHEHFSYLSLHVARRVLEAHGLTVFDVQKLPTHGGSLRIFARHTNSAHWPLQDGVEALAQEEQDAGLEDLVTYQEFAERVVAAKCHLLDFLIGARREGKTVVGYGAPAKGNTLLNYCGVGPELVSYTVDRSPHKQGMFLPGSRIPIRPPEAIFETRPDYVLILPWNLEDEITEQMKGIREWGGQFVVSTDGVRVW